MEMGLYKKGGFEFFMTKYCLSFGILLLGCLLYACNPFSRQEVSSTPNNISPKIRENIKSARERLKDSKPKVDFGGGDYLAMDGRDIFEKTGTVLLDESFEEIDFLSGVILEENIIVKKEDIILAKLSSDYREGIYSIKDKDWIHLPNFQAEIIKLEEEEGKEEKYLVREKLEYEYTTWEDFGDKEIYQINEKSIIEKQNYVVNTKGEKLYDLPYGESYQVGGYIWIQKKYKKEGYEVTGYTYGIDIYSLEGRFIRSMNAPEGYKLFFFFYDNYIHPRDKKYQTFSLVNYGQYYPYLYTSDGTLLFDSDTLRYECMIQAEKLGVMLKISEISIEDVISDMDFLSIRVIDSITNGEFYILYDLKNRKIELISLEEGYGNHYEYEGIHYIIYPLDSIRYQVYKTDAISLGTFHKSEIYKDSLYSNSPVSQMKVIDGKLAITNILTQETITLEIEDKNILQEIQMQGNVNELESYSFWKSEILNKNVIHISKGERSLVFYKGNMLLDGECIGGNYIDFYIAPYQQKQEEAMLLIEREDIANEEKENDRGGVYREKRRFIFNNKGELVLEDSDEKSNKKNILYISDSFYIAEHGNYIEFYSIEENTFIKRILLNGDE